MFTILKNNSNLWPYSRPSPAFFNFYSSIIKFGEKLNGIKEQQWSLRTVISLFSSHNDLQSVSTLKVGNINIYTTCIAWSLRMGDPKAFRLAAYSTAQSSAAWAIPNACDAIPIRPESGNQKMSSMNKTQLQDSSLLGCNPVLLGRWFPTFQRYSPQSIQTLIMKAILPFKTLAISHPKMQCYIP